MSKSAYSSRKKVFITQDDYNTSDSNKSRQGFEFFNPTQDLSHLKKKYDTVKQDNIKKTQYLEWLNGKVLDLKSTSNSILVDMKTYKNRSEELQSEIEKASIQLEQEMEMKKVYEHILFRNKTQGTYLDIRVNKFSENLKSARLRLDLENEKARKSKDLKYNAKIMLKEFKESLIKDTKKQFDQISYLETNITNRRELVRRHDERTKRQAEIIELAARNDREAHEKSIREQIKINQLLFDILIEKEFHHKKAGREIEMAFQDIKAKTGITNPEEILNKFTCREETHNRLIESVETAETNLEVHRKLYNSLRDQLKHLLLLTENENSLNNNESKARIEEAYKNFEKIRIQKKKTSNVFRVISKWTSKVCEKLAIPFTEDFEACIDSISNKVNSLVSAAHNNKEEFEANIKSFETKETKELLEGIYKDSPIRLHTSV
jgi:hypothetical protein